MSTDKIDPEDLRSYLEFLGRSGELFPEKAVIDHIMSEEPEFALTDMESEEMLQKLSIALKRKREIAERLSNMDSIMHFGEYVQLLRENSNLTREEFGRILKCESLNITNLELNFISPLEVPIKQMSKIIDYLKINLKTVASLIKKSILLSNFSKNLSSSFGRIDRKVGQTERSYSLLKSREELFLKKALRKLTPERKKEIDKEITKFFERLKQESE